MNKQIASLSILFIGTSVLWYTQLPSALEGSTQPKNLVIEKPSISLVESLEASHDLNTSKDPSMQLKPDSKPGVDDVKKLDPRLQKALRSLVNKLYELGQNYESRDQELRALMQQMTKKDLELLSAMALNTSRNNDERRVSVYLLGLAGVQASVALKKVAAAALPDLGGQNDPHSYGFMQASVESALRLSALRALDSLSLSHDVKSELQSVIQTQTDPSLVFFAQVSLAGVQEGRPGKLERLALGLDK